MNNNTTKHSREPEDVSLAEEDRITKEAQVTDNPFSGFGRPFSNDNPLMSEQYFQDNPAAATAPYSADSSYSINTVSPYRPPHSGEENPSQNVGPYNPAATLPQTTDADFDEDDLPANVGQDTDSEVDARTIQAAYKNWNAKTAWYDGTPESIYGHIVEGQQIKIAAKAIGEVEVEDLVDEQLDVLNKVANEISDANLEEYLEAVPGGTVAMEYDDLSNGGLVDTSSFLYTTAAIVIKEANSIDWDSFTSEGARHWVSQKLDDNPGLLQHETMVRKAAVDYAKDKTMALMDPIHRAEVIDGFVTNAERYRREAANVLHKALEENEAAEAHLEEIRRFEAKKLAAEQYPDVDEFYPGSYVTQGPDFIDGQLDIGEDDGSVLYKAAAESLEAQNKDWPAFTTEGARQWIAERAEKNAGILSSPDLTYRASSKYAEEATKMIKDASVRKEVVRAFTESVEYLREQSENSRTASAPERSEFDDIYESEEEILW